MGSSLGYYVTCVKSFGQAYNGRTHTHHAHGRNTSLFYLLSTTLSPASPSLFLIFLLSPSRFVVRFPAFALPSLFFHPYVLIPPPLFPVRLSLSLLHSIPYYFSPDPISLLCKLPYVSAHVILNKLDFYHPHKKRLLRYYWPVVFVGNIYFIRVA